MVTIGQAAQPAGVLATGSQAASGAPKNVLQPPVAIVSGAVGVGLIGAAVAGPLGASFGMVVGGLLAHLIDRHASVDVR